MKALSPRKFTDSVFNIAREKYHVIPAQEGIQEGSQRAGTLLDPRLRGDDEKEKIGNKLRKLSW